MAFSSIPAYNLDPSNWQQVPNHQLVDADAINNTSSSFPPPALSTALQSHGPGDMIRPGSMAERARIANIPMPESALKCPRCESTNTKFCYFNNYTLTQPRYFCKTCRRYWTQGGALRNVPVGGGCRRNNKKSNKSNNSRSKVVASSAGQTGGVGSASTGILPSSGGGSSADGLLISGWPVSPQLRFMAPNLAHHLGDHFGGLNNYKENTSMSGGAADLNFHATDHLGIDSGIFSGPSGPHSIGFYPFRGGFIDSSALNNGASQVGEKMLSSGPSHLASVKLEHNQELNLSRQFQGMAGDYEHQYSFSGAGSAWTSSSASLISSSSMNTNNAAWGDQML